MKKIIPLLLVTLLLSGCTWFQRGLDVCQDDACFMELAGAASERGDSEQAKEFCEAILAETLKAECLDAIQQ